MRPAWTPPPTLLAALGACALASWWWLGHVDGPADVAASDPAPRLDAVAFADLPGWRADDHEAAWGAFRRSCARIDATAKGTAARQGTRGALLAVCRRALALGEPVTGGAARDFFEAEFVPYRVADPGSGGFLTGYFEPELAGARQPTARYTVPLYARPDDLVTRGSELERAALNDELTAARRTDAGLRSYPTRREIEQGALAGRGLELAFLADPVDAFILHVQGSGLIALDDGRQVRVAYAAKNGHPYTSIGRLLVQRGEVALEDMSLETLKEWLRANPDRGRKLMWENESFIFFRELSADLAARGPEGAQGVALTPGRSLAVDGSIHALGLPIWVESPELDVHGAPGFRRLMIAQDVGSAIRGAERGDIFWGSGAEAGRIAGRTRHAGRFAVLLPKAAEPGP